MLFIQRHSAKIKDKSHSDGESPLPSYLWSLLEVNDFPSNALAGRGASSTTLFLRLCPEVELPSPAMAASAVTLLPPNILPCGMSVTYWGGLSRTMNVVVLKDTAAALSLRPAQIFRTIDNIGKDSRR